MTHRQRAEQGGATLFVVAGVCALLLAVPISMWLSRAPAGLSQFDRLGAEIGCQCGTCPMRPIATCGCGFADGMLARLSTETAAGKTDADIMAVFAAEYGPGIQIKPQGSGIGLLAWLAPMSLLMVGGVVMAALITRWREQAAEAEIQVADAVTTPTAAAGNDAYRQLVERELESLDD